MTGKKKEIISFFDPHLAWARYLLHKQSFSEKGWKKGGKTRERLRLSRAAENEWQMKRLENNEIKIISFV